MFFSKTIAFAAGLATFALAIPLDARAGSDGNRLTIYWGAEDDTTTLSDVCNDDSYDIVNLAFLDTFFSSGGWPSLSLSTLNGPSQAQTDAGATSLQDGTPLVPAIQACQSSGKLVLLSLGGADGNVQLSGDDQAQQIAQTLWDLFLGGTNNTDLRPFGSIKLDGFDLDNESGDSTGYLAMTQAMRSLLNSDTSKTYYLTAAPQCPYPDQSEPLDVCQLLDYVWVQFYNNGACDVARSDFVSAVKQWASGIGNAQLFIGALASGADGDQGYVNSSTLLQAYDEVKDSVHGIMLWEAQLSAKNGNYAAQVAAGL